MLKMTFAIAAVVAATHSWSAQAFAMAETGLPWVEHTLTKGAACGEGNDYGLEGQIAAGTKVRVKISMTAIYADGRKAEVSGTPVFVSAPQIAQLDREGVLVKQKNGVYRAPMNGAFRVFVGELQGDDYLYEKVSYEDYHILVCPAK